MWSEPLVRLPEQVCFTLAETGDILLAVDVAVDATTPRSQDGRLVRTVRVLVTGRLWPALGELLGEGTEEA